MSQAHPSDEQLSAALDGQDDGAAAHAAGCQSCQARQDELRAVMALVGSPVAVDAAVRDAAIAAAVRSAVGDDFARRGEIGIDRARGRRRVNWAPIAAVAAVFVLGLLAVPRLISDDGGGDAMTAARRDAPGAAVDEVGGRHGGDLGEVPDGLALLDRVAPALGVPSPGAAGDAATTASTTPGDHRLESSPAFATSGGSSSSGTAPARCSGVARRDYGTGLGPLLYTATARWREATPQGGSVSTPAVVLAYQLAEPAGGLRHRVLVMADGDCRLLSAVSL